MSFQCCAAIVGIRTPGCGCLNFLLDTTRATAFYTLSLHDALPISLNPWPSSDWIAFVSERGFAAVALLALAFFGDRKSTRLNSSHQITSYAAFCLKKKMRQTRPPASASPIPFSSLQRKVLP